MTRQTFENPPEFDDSGINLADPNDARGLKTEYISLLQSIALETYVGRGTSPALDLGCGYGRMTRRIADLGYSVMGMDPSHRVLRYAKRMAPEISYCVGRMPELPAATESFQLVFLLNVVRALHLMDLTDVCADAARVVASQGRLVILDNIRLGDNRYVQEDWFVDFFSSHGLRLKKRITVRAGRSLWIYLIRYGFISRRWFDQIAHWELKRMAHKKKAPRWSYHNVLFVFERS